ncbi:MAG TPA: SulP family inorganic anion transporter [Phycisphaerae bacterium]|nr:SulP family inorganic anion transporter [Phycisphaerae bacterium]HRW51434.1 SulP family inorganic anion transporter [Phycisphaerae bacterium]
MSHDTAAARGGLKDNLKHDFFASIVVFLVALPLCMGIAIASDVPIAAGIITGIIGGIVVGAFSGSPMQVSGPAAGLTVIIYGIVHNEKLGIEALGIIVLAAGVLQFIAGILKLGQWFRAVSPAVIQGMLAGIGVIIFSSQIHVMVDDNPRSNTLNNIASIPQAIEKGVFPIDWSVHHQAAYLGLITILIIVLWQIGAPKRLKAVPAALIAVTAATVIAYFTDLEILKISLPSNLAKSLTLPGIDQFKHLLEQPYIVAVFTIAIIASAETLLCANAVDQLHTGPRTRYDKELAAQGIGNALCGLFGALPMTGVIVRSSANIEAGARSRMSAIFHGVWLLVFVSFLASVLAHVPKSTLAAILVFTGYKLVNIKAIKRIWKDSPSEVIIYFATLITIVGRDLLSGVIVGVALAILKLVYTFSHLSIKYHDDPAANRAIIYLRGAATFISLPKLAQALEKVPANRELQVFLDQLDYVDHACLTLLMDWEKQHKSTGGRLLMDWEDLHPRFQRQRLNADGNETFQAARSNGSRHLNVEMEVARD